MRICIAKLSDTLEEMGVSPDVASFIENAPNQLKPLYVNTIKKNPNISLENLQQVQPEQKVDPYLDHEKQFVENNIPSELDNLRKWVLVNLRIARQGMNKNHPAFPPVTYIPFWNAIQQRISPIKDWVKAENPNLSNMTMADIMFAQEAWHQKMAQQGEGENYEPTNQNNIIYGPNWKNKDYNGWTIQEITSENDLDVEGNKMNHCVASYWNDVEDGRCIIYSLRDPSNNPHITIETDMETTEFRQIMGNSNSEPKDEYKAMVKEWVQSLGGKRYDVEADNSPVEKFYDLYSDTEEMIEHADAILVDNDNEYGLINYDSNTTFNIEDMIDTFIAKVEQESSRNYHDFDYKGAAKEAPQTFIDLARRVGEAEYNDPIRGLYELEKTLYQINEKFDNDFYSNWDWNYWEDPPDEEDFKTDEEYDTAMEAYDEKRLEAEGEEIDEHRRNYTRYALPDDTFRMLNEMRQSGHYPQWEELENTYNAKKTADLVNSANSVNWYKKAKISEFFLS